MDTTPNLFNPSGAGILVSQMYAKFNDVKSQVIIAFWNAFIVYFSRHFWQILGFVIFLAFCLYTWTIATGRWGSFGSYIYRVLFYSALIVLGICFGPKLFTNTYFELLTFVLYKACYALTGDILKKTGVR